MSTLKKDISSHLVTICDPVPVFPLKNRNKVYPAVLYSFRGGMAEPFYRDSFGLREGELTINVWAKSYAEMSKTAGTIAEALNGFTGTVGSTFIQRASVTNIFEQTEDESDLFRSVITVMFKM